ncbi:cupin domain-containing protein [Nguyenibacter sp. L1]|uniref:cupin domain-containing protein n=1 Tax=Nguyenibacter sp. L1 TaxID=3049350 RepID=UPI002B48C0D2|nr:cupin domain-containing protein [Nguyenibacter sp. L1]WRH89967.1 cupin domain-containing protein [Nguyenibacter sp. L1]
MRVGLGGFLAFSLLFSLAPGGGPRAAEKAGPMPAAARALVARHHMQPIPQEGGWFAQVLRTPETLPGGALPARYGGRAHPLSTAIFVLETRRDFSALHRLATDEVWHFYGGDPIRMLLLYPDGRGRTVTLDGGNPLFVVPQGVWQGSMPAGPRGWSFGGTTMAPGFMPEDFVLGDRAALARAYPGFADAIARLTRGAS